MRGKAAFNGQAAGYCFNDQSFSLTHFKRRETQNSLSRAGLGLDFRGKNRGSEVPVNPCPFVARCLWTFCGLSTLCREITKMFPLELDNFNQNENAEIPEF